jgi:hypothetical protein
MGSLLSKSPLLPGPEGVNKETPLNVSKAESRASQATQAFPSATIRF